MGKIFNGIIGMTWFIAGEIFVDWRPILIT
jgi:hypothetical protein